uniref:Uncharacterized protein n=1 Tax=Tanacetum cinerariifolium TaxID=118510 RepID=A0A699L7C1_TANCI|nr:hypothetical protein [Tanacetum cinerariifolium]
MSAPVFVDPESFTQADRAQSSRVPVPLLEDPYEAIRSTSSDSTASLSPDHPLTYTTPVVVPILHRTARMAVRVPSVMSPGLSAVWKRYRGTSELIFGTDSEEDEEIEESLDSGESEDVDDEGPTAEDEDPAIEDEGLADYEGRGIESDGLGLGEEEAVPEGQQRAVLVVGTTMSEPLGLGQGSGSAPEHERSERVSAFRQPTLTTWTDLEDGMIYIDVPVYPPPAPPVQTPPSPEWTSGSLPISPLLSAVPSPVSSPMIPLIIPSPIATSTATIPVDED